MTWTDKINESKAFLRTQGIPDCDLGIILGTGLGEIVNQMEIQQEIKYEEVPHLPEPTMEFHKGRILFGTLAQKEILVFEGRYHKYEGYDDMEITFPVRLLNAMGVRHLLISNAAGAINLNYNKGELMLIDDHINLQGGSPLAYQGNSDLGPKFVDMSEPYNTVLKNKALAIAKKEKLTLHEGVYASVVGPHLETRAEYKYLKIIGADAVGMSTVPEVIVANQLEMDVLAFSVLTDLCDPENLSPINIEDIMAMAKKAEQSLIIIVMQLIPQL